MKNWLFLGVAIVAEVLATSSLNASAGFTRLWPSVLVVLGYLVAFYFLSPGSAIHPGGDRLRHLGGFGHSADLPRWLDILWPKVGSGQCSWHDPDHRRRDGDQPVFQSDRLKPGLTPSDRPLGARSGVGSWRMVGSGLVVNADHNGIGLDQCVDLVSGLDLQLLDRLFGDH